jgi:hypothetical protein
MGQNPGCGDPKPRLFHRRYKLLGETDAAPEQKVVEGELTDRLRKRIEPQVSSSRG